MKQVTTGAVLVLIGIAIGIALAGCASTRIKHVTGAAFVERAEYVELPASLGKTAYIGVSDDRVYIEEQYFAAWISQFTRKPMTTVVWTHLQDLPPELAQRLKVGDPPWKPWAWNDNKSEEREQAASPNGANRAVGAP